MERLRAAAPELLVSVGDVRALGGPGGRYDAVYSPGVCEHFEAGPEAVLRETYRVLAPGGVAIVSTPCFSPLLGWLVSRRQGSAVPDPAGLEFYQYAFTPAGLSAVLRECGFEVVDVRPYGAFATLLDYTRPGRWLGARVPRRAMFGLEVAMDLAGLSRWMGRGCVWVARRPVGDREGVSA